MTKKSKTNKKLKKLLVGIFVDWMGSGTLTGVEVNRDQEVAQIKTWFKAFFGKKFKLDFVDSLNLLELTGKHLDVLIVDYGGVLPGCSGLISSIMREINKYVMENPSCLLILWTQTTAENYEEEIGFSEEGVLGDSVDKGSNVVVMKYPVEKAWKEIEEWLNCKE